MKRYSALITSPGEMYIEHVEADTLQEADEKIQEKLKEKYPRLYEDGWHLQPMWLDDAETGAHFDKVIYDD